MFNKMKRFMAILLSLTMLLSAMPMNALAETFSSGWVNPLDGVATYASYASAQEVLIRVGDTYTWEASSGNNHSWRSSNSRYVTVSGTSGSSQATFTGVQVGGPVTLTHTYYDDYSQRHSQTIIVYVTEDIVVHYDLNGGSGTAPEELEFDTTTTVTLPTNDGFERRGYTFMGWSTHPNGGRGEYEEPIYSANSSYIVSGSTTFYAVWAQSASAEFFIRLDGSIPTEPGGYDPSAYTGDGSKRPGDGMEGYYVVSPVLEGYVASRLVVSGTMPANNVVYTVIYVPETETVEIDRDGVSLNIGSVVMNVGDCFE